MKKVLIFLVVFILVLGSYSFADELDINGKGAILVDQDSGRILYEKDAHKKLYPASTTKMITAILAIEYGKFDEMVLVDDEIVSLTEGSHIALDRNEEVRFEDLLNALMIASANDSALALGKHIAGSIDDFVDMMNKKAKEIGAVNTNFANPHGLHDDNHYTTVYDLYLIANYSMKNELFREIVAKPSYTIPPTNIKEERIIQNTNQVLYGHPNVYVDGKRMPIKYEGISGIKTGFTNDAGSCLVSYASRDGRNIYAIVMNSEGTQVYADTMKLMDHGFNNFKNTLIAPANEFIQNVDIENGTLPYVSAVLDKNVYYTLSSEEAYAVEQSISLNEEIIAPISEGDSLGSVEYYLDGKMVAKANMVSTSSVDLVPATKLKDIILSKWYLIVFGIWLIYRLVVIYNKRNRRKRRRSNLYGYNSIK